MNLNLTIHVPLGDASDSESLVAVSFSLEQVTVEEAGCSSSPSSSSSSDEPESSWTSSSSSSPSLGGYTGFLEQ